MRLLLTAGACLTALMGCSTAGLDAPQAAPPVASPALPAFETPSSFTQAEHAKVLAARNFADMQDFAFAR